MTFTELTQKVADLETMFVAEWARHRLSGKTECDVEYLDMASRAFKQLKLEMLKGIENDQPRR